MTPEEWVRVALRRVPRALARARYASIRQLEMKVSEAGPLMQRPNPIHVREALNALVQSGAAGFDPAIHRGGFNLPGFYTVPDFSTTNAADAERRERVRRLYVEFLSVNRDDQGKTLERTVYAASLEARRAGSYLVVIGSPDRPPDANVVLNDVPVADALDLILVNRDGTVAIEAKNLREWITPQSSEVWGLIGKALRHDALPVLICRKVTYDTFLFFKQMGGLAFQTHGQLFPIGAEARLADVKHKDGLGFHDIRFGDNPGPRLLRFITDTVPRYLPDKLGQFRANQPLLQRYAIDAGLEDDDIPGDRRRVIYRAFFREMKGWDEDDPPDPGV